MSEPQFTKGEWRFSDQYDLITVSKKGIIEGSKTICDLNLNVGDMENIDEMTANANLIAAAPDMYHALKHLKEWFSKLKDWEGVGDPDVVEIMFAIDKAEGKISNPKTKTT